MSDWAPGSGNFKPGQQEAAVRRTHARAVAEENWKLVVAIEKANPDLFPRRAR